MSSKLPFAIKSLRSNLISSYKQQQRGSMAWTHTSSCYFSSAVEASDVEDDKLHDDMKAAEKHTALHSALSELAGAFDGESMVFLQRFFGARVKPVISTGSLKLDLALGIGGLPKGRIVEIYGHEASGKTTLALNVIREAQKLGGYCAYLDVENALNPQMLEIIGVNTKSLLISQPNSAENLLSIVDTLTKSGMVDVIVVDSVAALIPQSEIAGLISDNIIETQSKIMTQAIRKIHFSLCRSETLIIFINQVRSNLKSRQEGLKNVSEVTCGGNALPFFSAVRMRIARKGLLKTQEKCHLCHRHYCLCCHFCQPLLSAPTPPLLLLQLPQDCLCLPLPLAAINTNIITGLGICVEIMKNKLAPAMKKAELEIEFGKGISRASEILELACKHGIALKEGSCYFIEGEVFNSKEHAETYLIQNELICDNLVKTLRRRLFRVDDESES